VQCKHIPNGADMTQLGIKGMQNAQMEQLLSGQEQYMKVLRSMLGDTDNRYKRGKELLTEIIASMEDGKGEANFAALAKFVEADQAMQATFKRRSWIFLGNQSDARRKLTVQRSIVKKVSQMVPVMSYFESKTGESEFSRLQNDLEPIFNNVEQESVFSYQAPLGDHPENGENVFNWGKFPAQECDEKKVGQTCLVELQFTFEMFYNSFADAPEEAEVGDELDRTKTDAAIQEFVSKEDNKKMKKKKKKKTAYAKLADLDDDGGD